jgi:hypothetical protein
MRSNQIFGVTIVAFSLGIGGALAATPTFNMQDKSISRRPANTSSSASGLSLIANSMNSKTPKGYTALTGSETKRAVFGMRFSPNRGAENSGALRGQMPNRSNGLADLTPGLPTGTPPAVRRLVAAANGRDNIKALSRLSAH